jgi:hypothetical protein
MSANSEGAYEEALDGANPHSYLGLLRIVQYFTGAYDVVRNRIVLCRRADPARTPNTRHAYPAAVFGPARNIRAEENAILVRIRVLLDELNALQLEQLAYYCNRDNGGHTWEARPDEGIEVCAECGTERLLVSSESSSAADSVGSAA